MRHVVNSHDRFRAGWRESPIEIVSFMDDVRRIVVQHPSNETCINSLDNPSCFWKLMHVPSAHPKCRVVFQILVYKERRKNFGFVFIRGLKPFCNLDKVPGDPSIFLPAEDLMIVNYAHRLESRHHRFSEFRN